VPFEKSKDILFLFLHRKLFQQPTLEECVWKEADFACHNAFVINNLNIYSQCIRGQSSGGSGLAQ